MGKENRLEQLRIKVGEIDKKIKEIGHVPDSLRPTDHGKKLRYQLSYLTKKHGRLRLEIQEIEKELSEDQEI